MCPQPPGRPQPKHIVKIAHVKTLHCPDTSGCLAGCCAQPNLDIGLEGVRRPGGCKMSASAPAVDVQVCHQGILLPPLL